VTDYVAQATVGVTTEIIDREVYKSWFGGGRTCEIFLNISHIAMSIVRTILVTGSNQGAFFLANSSSVSRAPNSRRTSSVIAME
jgi:hypothetical protein